MKTKFILFASVATIFFASCEKESMENLAPLQSSNKVVEQSENENSNMLLGPIVGIKPIVWKTPKSKEEVISMNLDREFSIPSDVYNEFVESLTFIDDSFRGCIYDRLEAMFNDEQSERFWANLGISVRKIIYINPRAAELGPNIFQGYKPRTRGCRSNSRWICTLTGDVQI